MPCHRGGDGPARAADQHGQLVLPPTRVLLPEVERRQRQLRRPGGLGYPPGAAAPSLQAREALGLVAAFLTASSSGQKETGTDYSEFNMRQPPRRSWCIGSSSPTPPSSQSIGPGGESRRCGCCVCGAPHREGAGTCRARCLSASRAAESTVESTKERILTRETTIGLVTVVALEMDAMAGEWDGGPEAMERRRAAEGPETDGRRERDS